jgi:predicted DNA-binding protein (MmcQ/YjbR family)
MDVNHAPLARPAFHFNGATWIARYLAAYGKPRPAAAFAS